MATAAKKSSRVDPAPRRVDHSSYENSAILNADPKKRYVWAYKAGEAIGFYENRGYEIETLTADGPRSAVSRKKGLAMGTPVEWNSNVLMSIDAAEQAEYEAAGQAHVDQLESRIISKVGGGVDNLRGINGLRGRDNQPVLSLENGTHATTVEIE